jgi:Sulphur transport/Rhodanese-like domain
MLPFQSLIVEHREIGLVVAVLIGFAFGFVLERAGFGRATKLAAQFYLHDMTVLKVMFSAIVTAMLGMALAGGVGLVDLRALSESAVSYTYLWPMLVGGLLLGAGFIISGYCPGTSVVGIASGNLDAVFAYLGVIIGSVMYGELFPLVSAFHVSGNFEHVFLYDLLGIPAPIVAALVAGVAVVLFIGVEKVERIFKARRGEDVPDPQDTRRPIALALGTVSLLAVLVLGSLAVPTQEVEAKNREVQVLGQEDFAKKLLDEPWNLRILDIRVREACAKQRIPGAECVPKDKVSGLGLAYESGAKDLVLVGQKNAKVPGAVLAYKGNVYVLNGGNDGWRDFALKPPTQSGQGVEALERYRFRAALHSVMTGLKPAPPPKASGAYVPKKKKKKGGGCS